MRFMMTARPLSPLPPEYAPALLDAFAAWWDRYQDRWNAGFFAGGGGGGGICEVANETEFHTMMMEWPLAPFSNIDAQLLIDVSASIEQWRTVAASMMKPTSPD